MNKRVIDAAAELEALLPLLMRGLFQNGSRDDAIDLTLAQLRLIRLLEKSSLTVSEVSAELGMTCGAVTQVANKLQTRGLIGKKRDPRDLRVRRLALSSKGLSMMRARKRLRALSASQVLSSMPQDRVRKGLVVLRALAKACKKAPRSGSKRAARWDAEP